MSDKMKKTLAQILHYVLSALILITLFLTAPAVADSVIRIIGDRPSRPPESSDSSAISNIPPLMERNTIRIVGDKQANTVTPVAEQSVRQLPNQDSSSTKGIRIIGDKSEIVQKTVPEQKIDTIPEEKRLAKETDEQLKAQRLEAIKKEEEFKSAEKMVKERLEQLRIEEEKDALRKAALKKEHDLLTARKAEEFRKATTQAELDRSSDIKRDEDLLATARKSLVEKLRSETDTTPKQLKSDYASEDPTTTFVIRKESDTSGDQSFGAPPATIWDLYLSAKANDPALARTGARVTGSKAETEIVRSSLLPHLNSSAGVKQVSQSLSDYSTADASYNYTALNYNVSANLTLVNVPTFYSLSAAAAALSAEKAGVAAARQNLIVKFVDAYFSLLKAQTDKQIARGEINRLKQVLEQSQAFLKAGIGDIISVYEAQSRLDSAEAEFAKSESSLRLAEQRLSSQVGKPVTDVVNYIPQNPAGPEPDNIEWWVTTTEKEQPVLQQARESVIQTSEQRKAAKSEYLPTLQASGGYDVNRGAAALPTAEVRQWFVGATMSLPLYSGGETAAKVRRAVASEEERQHLFDETLEQQRQNAKQAFFNLRYNISMIKALDQRKASAEIQLAAIKKGRKIGTRNAIDVLNAEQTYSLALRDYRYALYDNIIRVIQLKSAAGILSEGDLTKLAGMEAPAPGNGLNLIISQASTNKLVP